MHRPETPAGSTHSLSRALRPPERLERQAVLSEKFPNGEPGTLRIHLSQLRCQCQAFLTLLHPHLCPIYLSWAHCWAASTTVLSRTFSSSQTDPKSPGNTHPHASPWPHRLVQSPRGPMWVESHKICPVGTGVDGRSGDNCLFRANFDRHRTSIFPDAQDNPTGRVLPTGERKTEPRAVSGFPRSQSASASTRTTPILIPRLLSFCSSPHCDHSLPSDASVPQEEITK